MSQKVNRLQGHAENTRQNDDCQCQPMENNCSEGEVAYNVDAAAATGERKGDSVYSSPPPASAVHFSDHQSSDGESLSPSIDTLQLHATDKAKIETNSNAGQQEHLKPTSRPTGIFRHATDSII